MIIVTSMIILRITENHNFYLFFDAWIFLNDN